MQTRSQVQTSSHQENWLFLKRWLKHPLRLGAVAPSSAALTRLITKHVKFEPDSYILEAGGGTGRLTRALLESGIPADRLLVIELDPELCTYLKETLPEAHVIQGDAAELPKLLPQHVIGKISMVVSGIPFVSMPLPKLKEIVEASFSVMHEKGEMLQFTYGPLSPLPAARLGLSKELLGRIFLNLPPAALWRYRREAIQKVA